MNKHYVWERTESKFLPLKLIFLLLVCKQDFPSSLSSWPPKSGIPSCKFHQKDKGSFISFPTLQPQRKSLSEKVGVVSLGIAKAGEGPFPGWTIWVVPLWQMETIKKHKAAQKVLLWWWLWSHCWHMLSMLKAYSPEFQEHIGLHWNKSSNYWSFPSNKESARKATWKPVRVCLLNHHVGIWHSAPVLFSSGHLERSHLWNVHMTLKFRQCFWRLSQSRHQLMKL